MRRTMWFPTIANPPHLRALETPKVLKLSVYHFIKDPNKDEEPKTKQKENDKNKNIQHNDIEQININFGFRTPENAPQPKELVAFENSLNYLISNLKYKFLELMNFKKS